MKKWQIVVLIGLVIILLPFCFIFFNSISLHNALKSTYNEYTYSMPSIDSKGEIYIDEQISDKFDISIITISLQDNEQFLEMRYKKPIKIIVCKDDTESARIFHYFQTKGSGFAFSDNLIIINYRNLIDLGYTFDSIIRHESSHTLLKQNIDSFITMIWTFSNDSLWFSEGLAIYNQGLVIFTLNELKTALTVCDVQYDESTNNFFSVPQNYRTDYSMYHHFMKYLIEKYSQEKMISYTKLMIEDYAEPDKNFEVIFKSDIQIELVYFCEHVLEKELLTKDEI